MTFDEWWEKEGQYCRAGSGKYEKTFAYLSWQAAYTFGPYSESTAVIALDGVLDAVDEVIAKHDAKEERFIMLKIKLWPILLGLAIGFCLPPKAKADDSPDIPYLPEMALALHAVDYGQTMGIAKDCQHDSTIWESNPALGRCPTRAKVNSYFLTTGLGLYLFSKFGPEEYRSTVAKYWAGLELVVVSRNAYLGYRISF